MHRLNSLALGAALTVMLVLHAGIAEAARLTRSPYLQLVRPDSALVVFQTDTACDSARVRYGESGDTRNTALSKDAGTRHAVALTGLTPTTGYTYVVEDCGAFTAPRRLLTAPAPGTPRVHFVAVGDFGNNSSAQKQVAARMHQQRPELFLTLGDNAYDDGTEQDYQQKMFEPMAELLSEVPAFAALGNHDYGEGAQARPFLDNFHLPTASGTERFYSFDWGHVHFVALDSTCAMGGAMSLAECSPAKQKAWLEKDLAASQATWKIVYFHHPPWSSGSHGPSKHMLDFSPLFEKHGVDLVLSGHEHDYERSHPMKGKLQASDGIPYLVVGNGGTPLRPFTGPTPAWSAARNSTTHGFLDVVVEGGTLTARMLDTAGAVRDSLTLTKSLGDLPECPVAERDEADELAASRCTPHPVLGLIANGDDGNPPSHTLDDRLDTRWSQFGKGAWIDYDLGSEQRISGAAIAWHEGNTRTNAFTLSVSSDGRTYTPICKGTSSGTTTAAETLAFAPRTARRLRITVQGNSKNDWASIAEARVCVDSKDTSPTHPASVGWRGDFETGDDSQWQKNESVSADRLRVVSSPVREGRFALKVTVKQGDDPINASGNRNELVRRTFEPEGSGVCLPLEHPVRPRLPEREALAALHPVAPRGHQRLPSGGVLRLRRGAAAENRRQPGHHRVARAAGA